MYGGGAIYALNGGIDVIATSFIENTAENGGDIYVANAEVIISEDCPQGEGGEPTEGEYKLASTSSFDLTPILTLFFPY